MIVIFLRWDKHTPVHPSAWNVLANSLKTNTLSLPTSRHQLKHFSTSLCKHTMNAIYR